MDSESHIFDSSKSYSPLSVDASKTAVLLMDYHNMIVGMCGEDGARVVKNAGALRDWALEHGMTVFHCLIDMAGTPPDWSKMSARFGAMAGMLKDKPEMSYESSDVAPKGGKEKTVKRIPGLVSVIHSDSLEAQLKEHGIKSLLLAGLSSSGCVLSTTRDAADRGYLVTVVEDACADRVDGLHDMLMKHALPMTAHVATLKDIQAAWK